ncbi:hypothetical protein ACHAPJ_010804 [Fusarium lateritium]
MEVIGGVAAVMQLVQTLGTTIIQVSDAYSQVRDMDDVVRDFDSQLDATRMLLSILGDGISCGSLNPSIQGWWRQSELERLLRSCQQSFNRLNNIFIKIARQRATVQNLRAWIRLKGYNDDINHLRLSINTCTNALQLPVIIHNIHSNGQARPPTLLEDEVPDLLEELTTRMANLESSMARAQDDLVTRALQKSQVLSSPTHHLTAIENMIKELKSEMSTLAASKHTQTSSISRGETEAQLAQIQLTLSQLRVGVSHEDKDNRSILESQEAKEKSDMENETRSMLALMNGLVGSVQDYVSTIDAMSVSTKRTWRQPSRISQATGGSHLQATFQTSQSLSFPPAQLSRDKRRGIVDWVDNVDDEDSSSLTSMSSALRPRSEGSREIPMTPITTQSSDTVVSGNKFHAELRQRRIRIVEGLMRKGNYIKVLPHLEQLLASNDDSTDVGAETRLCYFMARALSETTPEEEVVDSYCKRFPLIKPKLPELRLERAVKALSRKDHILVTDILRPYKSSFTPEIETASMELTDINTLQRIQMVFGQALFESPSYKDKHEAMSILEALLEQSTLGLMDRGLTHNSLAKAFYFQGDYEKAKKHGVSACQIKMDLIGRDDEETQRSIALVVNICSDAQDSDEALWRQMLLDMSDTEKSEIESPLPFVISRYPPDLGAERLMRKAREAMKTDRPTTTRISLLKENYMIRDIDSVSYYRDIMCFSCLYGDVIMTKSFCLSWRRAACSRHSSKLAVVHFTGGPSLLHYFAVSRPRNNETSDDCPRPDCISELSILIEQAKTMAAQLSDLKRNDKMDESPMPPPTTEQLNHGFLLHELINAPMALALGERGSREKHYIEISPLWGAALSGNLSTVSFFLSLGETDVTAGSRSVLLLQRPDKRSNSEQQNESDVFRAVSMAFNALPVEQAQDLLSTQIVQGEKDAHWCFSNHYLLEKVLEKCGEVSADVVVNDWLTPCPIDDRVSLLDNFLSFTRNKSREAFNGTTRKEFRAMLRSLLKHSTSDQSSASSKRRITGLINSIRGAVDLMIDSRQKGSSTTRTEQKIMLWARFIEVLVDGGYTVEDRGRLALQCCVDRLNVSEPVLIDLERVEGKLSNDRKTLEFEIRLNKWGYLWERVKGPKLVRRKEKISKRIQDLQGPKKALIAKVNIRDRLKKLCEDIDVPRDESPPEPDGSSHNSVLEPDSLKQTTEEIDEADESNSTDSSGGTSLETEGL